MPGTCQSQVSNFEVYYRRVAFIEMNFRNLHLTIDGGHLQATGGNYNRINISENKEIWFTSNRYFTYNLHIGQRQSFIENLSENITVSIDNENAYWELVNLLIIIKQINKVLNMCLLSKNILENQHKIVIKNSLILSKVFKVFIISLFSLGIISFIMLLIFG